MTECSVYVGDLDDPKFLWEGGDWNGNVPRALSNDSLSQGGHYNAFFHAWVAKAGVTSRQTDYGGWVARVNKKQLLSFLTEGYVGQEDLPWIADRLPDLRAFIESLVDDKEFALVATEF